MKIKQVILSDPAHDACFIPQSLKQLGLQISDHNGQDNYSDSLLICPPGYEADIKCSLLIRRALACCGAVLMKESDAPRRSGGNSPDRRPRPCHQRPPGSLCPLLLPAERRPPAGVPPGGQIRNAPLCRRSL
jgi:hypothetical protein